MFPSDHSVSRKGISGRPAGEVFPGNRSLKADRASVWPHLRKLHPEIPAFSFFQLSAGIFADIGKVRKKTSVPTTDRSYHTITVRSHTDHSYRKITSGSQLS